MTQPDFRIRFSSTSQIIDDKANIYSFKTFHYTVVLSAISRFGIAEHVPTDGRPIAIKDLAAACHLKLADLMPLLRAAIANRTFEAVGDSEVKRNAPSAAIAAMPDLRHWLAYSNEDFIPAAFALPEAIAKWPGATSPDRAAFALLTPEHLALFDAISADPASAERFAGSMRLLGSAAAAEIPRIVEAPGFDSLAKDLVVVDVGGSMGEVLTQVLRRYSQINGVVQDLQPVIAKAQVPKDLDGRLTFQVADFFEPQTQEGAGVFVLRKVLHDWSDEYAEKIIRQLIPALRNGTKIVLNEICLPRHGETHPRREQNQRGWDLAMKWLLNGKERDEAEWRKLFTNIDARFKWVGARPVPAATSSLIEVLWEA